MSTPSTSALASTNPAGAPPRLAPPASPGLGIPPPPTPPTFTLSFCQSLTGKDPSVVLDLRSHRTFQGMVQFYESIRLVSISASISGEPGAGRSIEAGFSSFRTAPAAFSHASLPFGSILWYTDSSAPSMLVALPPTHVFGVELKAAVLGSSPPVLHARINGVPATTTTATAVVRVDVAVSCHGSAPLTSIPIT